MNYLFTSESVSEGHPDKIADQISDAILDAILAKDPEGRVACETLVTTGLVVLAGEISTTAYVDMREVVRDVIQQIGYDNSDYYFDAQSCGIITSINKQSADIAQGVNEGEGLDEEQGAGDQGMMFGFATDETPEYMPMSLAFSHRLVKDLAQIRKNEPDLMPYLRPDAKSQVTIEYDENHQPKRVHTIVISTQHDDFDSEEKMLKKIKEDVIEHLVKRVIPEELLDDETIYHVNPTGRFIIGGPHGDVGLTGRKIIVDTYGGAGAHGGGAFSGKDPSKVDRSAAYATRYIAKNLVAAGVAKQILVQVSYAIGVAQPISLYINTQGTSQVDLSDIEISAKVSELFDLRPSAIIQKFNLKSPIYLPCAAYGHMGREAYRKNELVFFPWEELDSVDMLKKAFGI